MKENWLNIFLKGLCVGGTMLVPGVSGGSMAMILGIYDKLITSVSSFFACKKRNALFLLLFALGGGAGMLLFANPLLYLLEGTMFQSPVYIDFFGIPIFLWIIQERSFRSFWQSGLPPGVKRCLTGLCRIW